MSVAGPSGSGKTMLEFCSLQGNTYHPCFEKSYYFYEELQPPFRDMQGKIQHIDFIKYSSFELESSSKCGLVQEDSRKEVFKDIEFVIKAISRRYRKFHVIYVKHSLFHQNKCSRTINVSTIYI